MEVVLTTFQSSIKMYVCTAHSVCAQLNLFYTTENLFLNLSRLVGSRFEDPFACKIIEYRTVS